MTNDIQPAPKSKSIGPGRPISRSSTILEGPDRTLPFGYIHLGVAKEIAPTLRDFGVDPDPVIREAGLDPYRFDDCANVIPHAAFLRSGYLDRRGRFSDADPADEGQPGTRALGRCSAAVAYAADEPPLFGQGIAGSLAMHRRTRQIVNSYGQLVSLCP